MPKTFTNKVELKTDESTGALKLKILGVPFGGHIKGRDFDGDYFSDETYFGDDCGVNECYVTLDHALVKDSSGRVIMPPKDAFIGMAKYIETDAAGRWYEASITKGQQYNKAIQALSDAGMLYASSQPIQTSVTKDLDQHIKSWVVGEIALTSHPNNMLAATEILSKSFDGVIKNDEGGSAEADDDFIIVDVVKKEKTETEAPVETEETQTLSDEINDILNSVPEQTSTASDEGEAKSTDVDVLLKEIRNSVGAYIDFWGDLEGDETMAQLLMRMIETSAKTLDLVEKNQKELVAQRAALKTYAEFTAKTMDGHLKNVVSNHVKETLEMSEAEKKAYEAKQEASRKSNKKSTNHYQSPVPTGAPGDN